MAPAMMDIGRIICSMAKENMFIKMEESTKEIGLMIKRVVLVLIIIIMEAGMKVNGAKILKMEEAKKFILMAHHMMAIIKMDSNMAKAFLFGQIRTSMKEIGSKVKLVDTANIFGMIIDNMWENG